VLKCDYRDGPESADWRAGWTSSSLATIDHQPLTMIAGSQNSIGMLISFS